MAVFRFYSLCWLPVLLCFSPVLWADETKFDFRDANYAASDDLQGALKQADEWRARAQANGDRALLLSALRLSVRVLCDRMDGNVAAIRRDLDAGLPLARELGNREAEAEFLIWGADILSREQKPEAALPAFDAAIAFAEVRDLPGHAAYARAFKARVYINRLNRSADGMAELVRAYAHFEKESDRLGMALASFMMGWAFMAAPEKEAKTKAIGYYQQALGHLDLTKSRNYAAYLHWWLGTQYRVLGDQVRAREHFLQGLSLRQQLSDPSGAANIELQLANMDLSEGRPEPALAGLDRIVAVFATTGETTFQFHALIAKIRALTMLGRRSEAAEALEQARVLAANINTPSSATGLHSAAMDFHAHFGDYQLAYEAAAELRKAEQRARDQSRSVEAAAIERRFADRLKEEMGRKELELAESRRVTQLTALATVILIILVGAGWLLQRTKHKAVERANARLEQQVAARTSELEGERMRTEGLLRNTLPDAVITELKSAGRVQPRRHESVSVMFSDFVGFTTISSTLPPDRLLVELGDIFGGFDVIAAAHGLDKIKTIGDSYMSVAGLHSDAGSHAAACVRAAQEMLAFVDRRNSGSAFKWQLRLGIHSGPVIAGVVGTSRFAYDIWGDTVNLASRMESVGTPGSITVSAYTADLLKGSFAVEYRGKVDVKGKGPLDIYTVRSA